MILAQGGRVMLEQREHGLEEIQDRVGALEHALFPGSAGARHHRAGIRISDWFLPTDIAWRIALTPTASRRDLGFLVKFGRGRVFRALLSRRRYPWCLHADALAINKNCRVFFLADGLTAKAHFSAVGRHDPIRAEIEARRAVICTERVRIPEILRHETTSAGSCFVERMIAGGNRVDPDSAAGELADALFEFYARNGASPLSLGEVTSPEPWQAAADEALSAAGIAASQIAIVRQRIAATFEVDAARPVLWGFCHGDLSIGNMLRADGKIFLLDWEEAHHGLIYGDLCKLFAAAPALEARFDVLARECCGDDAAISAQKLLAELALADKLWRESRRRKQAKKLVRLKAVAQNLIANSEQVHE